MTDTAVFLGVAASKFEDFNPASFALPDLIWHPTYPYQRKLVLLLNPVEPEQVNPEDVGMNQLFKVLA
jgi:hypothetical protein